LKSRRGREKAMRGVPEMVELSEGKKDGYGLR